jgi:FkbM family methyltransferase
LKANIYLNKLENIIPLYIALNKKSGLIYFCGQDDRFGASGNVVISPDEFKEDSALKKGDGQYKVKEIVLQASGDDLLKINLKPPNYVKIDVDGIELGIIEGMKDILKSDDLKSILVEINSKEDLVVVKNIFASYGLFPDDNFNMLDNHSRKRRSQDPQNTAENWVFTKA